MTAIYLTVILLWYPGQGGGDMGGRARCLPAGLVGKLSLTSHARKIFQFCRIFLEINI